MPDFQRVLSNPKQIAVIAGVAALAIVGVAYGWSKLQSPESATAPEATPLPPGPAMPELPEPTGESAPLMAATTAQAGEPAPPPEPPKATARISFTTSPPATATVTWGKTRLGVIRPGGSLVITRPRDSGPLDVIVRAPGYLPVQTRAHTFADSRIVVKLTPPDQIHTLLGYRAPLDAGIPLDGAMPEPVTTDPILP